MKNVVAIIVPLIFSILERIESISNVMDMRGFGQHHKRTWYVGRNFKMVDIVAIAICGVLVGVTLWLFAVNDGRFYNPFQS